ncbi:MAG: glycosyltransferase family A protein [Clostridia bacterium]
MNKKIIINMKFNMPFKHIKVSEKVLTEEWIEYRMNIFMNYTCNSLMNQTNQSFLAIIGYHDDTKDLIENALNRYPKLPQNIIFKPWHDSEVNKTIKDYIRECDYVYNVRLDCDDMYHPTFIQQLLDLEHNDDIECIINQKGYVYDCVNNRIGNLYHQSSPFFTLVYKPYEYPHKYNDSNFPKGHASVINLNHIILDNENYIVLIHEKNIETIFDLKNCDEIVANEGLKKKILEEFKVRKREELFRL